MRFIICTILTALVGYLTVNLYNISEHRNTIIQHYTEAKHIKYGLLSVYSWKNQISDILTKKVKEFQLTSENRNELRISIQRGMYQLLDELERIIQSKRENQNWWESMITSFIESIFFDVQDLKERVPEFTEIILDELDNYETREKLRSFIMQKIDALMYETVGNEDLSNLEAIGALYDCDGISECGSLLEIELAKTDEELQRKTLWAVILSFFTFLIILTANDKLRSKDFYLLLGLSGILLFGGISSPMIDIDARIDSFGFLLMGEQLEFTDQILFHQSKSISEVVQILISNKDYQSILVGILIFVFSIVFPVSKLISSIAIMDNPNLANNRLIHFLALKSGKWSMADVVVVAIFMAYIGFRGVISNQLSQLEGLSEKVEILTTDNSNFGVGFILFTSFCLGSLWISTKIEHYLKTQ